MFFEEPKMGMEMDMDMDMESPEVRARFSAPWAKSIKAS